MSKKSSLRETRELRNGLVRDKGYDKFTASYHAYRAWLFDKIGFYHLTKKLGVEKYAQKVADEKDFEKLLNYREDGHKRLAASYPIIIISIIGGPLIDPKILAVAPFGVYLNWRGECEFIPAEKRIKEITETKRDLLDEEIDRLEKKLYAKQRERKVRYIDGALQAYFLEPGAAFLIYIGYNLSDKGLAGKAIGVGLYIVGGCLALRGIGQFFGIRKNIKNEEADIRMELGDVYRESENLEEAISNYQKALGLNPQIKWKFKGLPKGDSRFCNTIGT